MAARERGVVQPPSLAARIVRAALPAHGAASHVADLEERFESVVQRRGAAAARRWYWRQALGFALRVPPARAFATLRRARSHGTDGVPAMLVRDVAYAARTLRARPGFTLPAIGILALAVTANSAVLSVVDNVLWRDLPFADPDEIVVLWDLRPPDSGSRGQMPVAFDHYLAWSERDDLFEQVVALDTIEPAIETNDYPIRAHGLIVSGNAFALLGATAALGRTLLPSDDPADAEPVVVISDRLWRTAYGADAGIVGRAISVDNQPVTVVGVMPAGFWFFDPYMFSRSIGERETAQPDLWRPLSAGGWNVLDPEYAAFRVLARLRPGVSVEAARASLTAMRSARVLEEGVPDIGVEVVPLADEVAGDMAGRLLLLQAAVTLLVLIACVNLMSLVLAKASAQRGELAVRAALGAGRASLVRLAVAETTLLGAAGGALGLLGAWALGGFILRIAPRELPLAHRVGIDARVAGITLAVALGAGVLAGLLPALGLDFKSLTRSLHAGSRNVAGSALGARARFALVAVEVALTLVLLIGATVMLRSFMGVWRTDPGFDARPALTFFSTLSTPPGEEPDYTFHTRLLDELRAIPGVEAAGATTHLPFSNWGRSLPVVAGEIDVEHAQAPRIAMRAVTERYLDAMGIRLLAGRDFTRADAGESEPVLIVNEAFVQRFFGESGNPEAAVGQTAGIVSFRTPRSVTPHLIVGVVENVKHSRLFESDRPIIYTALRQEPTVFLRFVVRTAGDPLALVEPVRRAAAAIDRRQPLTEIYPLETLVAQSLTEERFYTWLLGAFGLVAFGLAAVGVYGSVAYSARLRWREIGVRVAFGARPGAIRRLVIGQGLLPVALGVLAGCGGAVLLARGLAGLLHGISPLDAPSFAGAAVLFLAVAAVAALLPARRAAAVDPVEVLRSD